MSIEATLDRVSTIRQALADPALLLAGAAARTGGVQAPASSSPQGLSASTAPQAATVAASAGSPSFAAALEQASASPSSLGAYSPAQGLEGPTAQGLEGPTAQGLENPMMEGVDGVAGSQALAPLEGLGGRMVALAESQLGQTEQPPGSNESAAIAQYRTATVGAAPGTPWCGYFASWLAREAGDPIGEQGGGLGSVSAIWSWAQGAGRAIENGPGVVPQPGDLIVFGGEHVGIVRGVLPDGQIETIEGNYENKVAANVRSPTEATGYVSMS